MLVVIVVVVVVVVSFVHPVPSLSYSEGQRSQNQFKHSVSCLVSLLSSQPTYSSSPKSVTNLQHFPLAFAVCLKRVPKAEKTT